jgi:hypothetical protein
MKKIIAILIFSVIIIVTTFYFTVETYFSPYPYISTKFSPGFSLKKYNQVQNGMSKDEVRKLLGIPFEESSGPWHAPLKSGEILENCDEYSTEGGWWFAWIVINVCYDIDEKVYGKNELIMYN